MADFMNLIALIVNTWNWQEMQIGSVQTGNGGKMMDVDEFSEWLLDQMEERHLNCYQMSKLTGLSYVTIGYYITATRTPTFGSLKLILDALGKKVLIVDKEME